MDNFRKAKQEKALSGWFPGNPPLGYVVQNRAGTDARWSAIIPDPDKTKVQQVQLEFELRATGLSYKAIKQAVIAQGLIPPEDVSHYHFTSIEKRIKNPFYAGRFRWNGEEYQGRHELIVTPQVVRAAQRLLKNKTDSKEKRLAFLSCGECGSPISFESKTHVNSAGKKSVFSYYRCTNRNRFHSSMKGLFVPEKRVWEQIDALIEKIHLSLPLADQLARALNESRAGFVEAKKQEIQAADLQMHILDRMEDEALQQMIAGKKTSDEFNDVRLDARDVRNRLFDRIAQLRRDIIYSRDENAVSVLDLADRIKNFYVTKTAEEKISLVDLIYENLRLRGQQLECNFKNPFRAFMDADFGLN
jgi:hypothetical protein